MTSCKISDPLLICIVYIFLSYITIEHDIPYSLQQLGDTMNMRAIYAINIQTFRKEKKL